MFDKVKAVRLAIAFLCALCLGMAGGNNVALAQSFFNSPGKFIPSESCNATTSIRKATNPTPLAIGQEYVALGTNKSAGATHAFVEVDGERKWVALECGSLEDVSVEISPVVDDDGMVAIVFSPFFDTEDNPIQLNVGGLVDITPEPPELSKFDLAVNETCGLPGKVVSRQEFKILMNDYPEVLDEVYTYTGGKVFGDRPAATNREQFLDDLTDAWFNIEGFDHIFCGEPERGGKVGGLHFVGRYLDLQEKGLAGRILNNESREEVDPGAIYTLGVIMKVGDGIARSSIKGYGLTMNAADILKFVTKGFADNPTNSSRSTACKLDIEDDGESFTTVFVRRANGIRTFYPDATPSGGDPFCQKTVVARAPQPEVRETEAPAPEITTIAPKIAFGSTPRGATEWQQYGDRALYVDVDTSAAGFAETPTYITSLDGNTKHWRTVGSNAIYQESPTGFRVYIQRLGNSVTPEEANEMEWHVNWIAISTK